MVKFVSYLYILEVVGLTCPVHLGKEVLVQHLAEEFKQIYFTLIVGLYMGKVN